MQRQAASFWVIMGGVALLASSATAQQVPTISVKVVKHNGLCVGGVRDGQDCARDCDCQGGICDGDVTPTSNIVGSGGDRFVVELYASEWSPSPTAETLSAYQTQMEDDVLTSGSRGRLDIRVGARCCEPRPPVFPSSYECADLGVGCSNPSGPGFCSTGAANRAAGAYIERYRSDYVLFPNPELIGTDLSVPDTVRFSSVLTSDSNALPYTSIDTPKYMGSFALESTADACGIFRIELGTGPGDTVLLQPGGNLIVDPNTNELNIEPAFINLGACTCRRIISSDPQVCTLDAREPKTLAGVNETLDTLRVEVDCRRTDLQPIAVPSSFAMTVEGVGAPTPAITGVNVATPGPNGGTYADISFAPGSLSEGAWNCIQFDPPGPDIPTDRYCFGVLPGDVSENSLTEAADMDALDACLSGGTCTEFACDIDRSGACTPADRLRLVDVLTGAAQYSVWEGEGIVDGGGLPLPCPPQ